MRCGADCESWHTHLIRRPDVSRVIALVGPTGVGKTAVSIELAQLIGAEVVSCDAMQVYRDMAILTQAPTSAQRRQVSHYLVECVDSTETFNAGQYRRMAIPLINRLLERGKNVLIVGGTGLYLKALREGLCEAPPSDSKTREALWRECSGLGSVTLHNRLQTVDSPAALRIHPNDARRIIRALEVFALTGRPLSQWWKSPPAQVLREPILVVGLNRERSELYARIHQRLLHMVYEEGVINEVRRLLRSTLSLTARQVHGLADIEKYLSGQVSLKDALCVWQQRVRNYAKRQVTWFRHVPGIEWIDVTDDVRAWQIAERIENLIRRMELSSVIMDTTPV